MLALVKKPRIELSIHGENIKELIDWIRRKYEVEVLFSEDDESAPDESVPVEETDFWKEMQSNRIGNLLAGARLKVGFTQTRLARQVGVSQNMISDYERGKRRLSMSMAKRMANSLHIDIERLTEKGSDSPI